MLVARLERFDVEFVDLLAQRHPLARPHRLAQLVRIHWRAAGVDLGLRQIAFDRRPEPARETRGEVLVLEQPEDPMAIDRDAGVKPRDRLDRRLKQLEVGVT